MFGRIVGIGLLAALCVVSSSAQNLPPPSPNAAGLNTQVGRDDWEEINFEFNSAVLVDGFPSLLRLADLLKENPTFKVLVEGNTDDIGTNNYNNRLGLARAGAVRDYLVRNGAGAAQITTASRGAANPRTPARGNTRSLTDEARWLNRRVVLTVMDAQGRTVSDGGPGAAIRALGGGSPGGQGGQSAADVAAAQAAAAAAASQAAAAAAAAQRAADQLAEQNRALRDQVNNLQNQQADMQKTQQGIASTVDQTAQKVNQTADQIANQPKPPTAEEVAKAIDARNAQLYPRFQILAANVGATGNGDVTFTGKGRYFAPFGNDYAFQGEGEYYYVRGQREGQGDIAFIDRINRFQASLYASFKHVSLADNQTGGTIGQAGINLEYIFGWGKVGAYGTKGFLNNAVINRTGVIGPFGGANLFSERVLRVVDQAGVNATGPLFGANYFEGNVGYLRGTSVGDRVGGTLRLIFPISQKIALTAEGGINETLLAPGNNGRAVVGVMFGNRIRPTEMAGKPHAIPIQIPRVRYEVVTRVVRSGNDAPVADAGPNQTLSGPATVTLNGSNSYDPDGDPLTYLWTQESGPSVSLANPNAAITTFSATAAQSYVFRLTVRDNGGLQGTARVTISTGGPIIVSFTATPQSITVGQTSTLTWQTENADTVTITGVGNVQPSGSTIVQPGATTTYQITASRNGQTVTSTVTVQVNPVPAPVIQSFTATPSTIQITQGSVLAWVVTGADVVTITGVGNVPPTGQITVSPVATTTYVLAATKGNQTVTKQVTVTVQSGAPRIISFTASRANNLAGTPVTLTCVAENAVSVQIGEAIFASNTASIVVTPFVNTSYLCVANGTEGRTAQAQIQVDVVPTGLPPIIP